MHILVVNDDGPPSNQSSPYVHSLVTTLQGAGHKVSVCLPNTQRSWIGKAHIVGQTLTPTYFRPGTILKDDGITSERPFNDGKEEWVLINGTPASCVQIGLHHIFKDRGPIDLVLSGPNYGRNTTAVFAMSSGTIGGAMEGAASNFKSISLSYAFDSREHDEKVIAAASRVSLGLIEKFVAEWPEDVHLYSINVPLRPNVETTKILYTDILQNTWLSGGSFEELPEEASDADPKQEERKIRRRSDANESPAGDVPKSTGTRSHVSYKWSPRFADVRKAVEEAKQGDGWEVMQGNITVTPLKANFWHLPHYRGEIKLNNQTSTLSLRSENGSQSVYVIVDFPDTYVQPLIQRALELRMKSQLKFISSTGDLPHPDARLLQYTAYEALNFDHAAEHPGTSLICAYVIRKALIRKHYLSNTVSTWLVKNPEGVLATHFKPCTHFELDFAEFLDEALVDAWDLNESLTRNESIEQSSQREWWILKPGMSDGGNGIRLFSTMAELQAIFEEWEVAEEEEQEEEDEEREELKEEEQERATVSESTTETAVMTSQLRHFIAQPYIDPPLLLPSYGNHKFHIRAYVVAVGALKVFIYREMLALFAAKEYHTPTVVEEENDIDLRQHLTNTCFQDEATRDTSVHRFWDLQEAGLARGWQEALFGQICAITGEVFEAAAKEQMIHFQAIPNAFEVFGVDFLVDAGHNVWLLELNAYPDFKQTGEKLQDAVVGGLFDEVTRVAIEPFFGSSQHATDSEKMKLVKTIDLGRR